MALAQTKMTLDEYLVWENASPERHEYVNGEVFAMVGALRVHARVVGNVYFHVRRFLRGKPCQPFSESSKLQVGNDIFYPDIFVTCDPTDLKTEHVFRLPTLICEVLSPKTADYDRGAKFASYRRIASLREYVLVDPSSFEVTLFRRNAAGLFELHDYTGHDVVTFASLDVEITRADLFDGI
jgi:Uma2 family endonuclease